MKKHIFYLVLIICYSLVLSVLIFSLSGCGINEDKSNAATPALSEISDQETCTSQLIVLVYHDLIDGNGEPDGSSLKLEDFQRQMAYLSENNYQTLGLDEFLAYYNKGGFPEKCVMITFDDGYQSFLQLAYPLLKEYDLHAVIFPIVGLTPGLEQDIIWNQHMTFHDLRLMDKESGLIDIGSHTYDLHYYSEDGEPAVKRQSGESESDYISRITKDLRVSKEILELQTGKNITALAWPYGVTNKTAVRVAKELDYELLFTLCKGTVASDTPLDRIPRYAVNSGSMEDFIEILTNCQ